MATKEHPILFSGPMVRAILEGRKTQTRRVVASRSTAHPEFVLLEVENAWWPYFSDDGESEILDDGTKKPMSSPYGKVSDILWVRETARCDYRGTHDAHGDGMIGGVYAAGGGFIRTYDLKEQHKFQWFPKNYKNRNGSIKWHPSIFLPRWAARIFLEITDIRVERLRDISPEDCLAEGIIGGAILGGGGRCELTGKYEELWESINGKHSWSRNPYVWCITFRKVPE